MTILLFFILPFATILLSIVLQKLLKSPILVAITFFAIYLILTYTVFGTSFLIFAIVYSILAYITAAITRLICTIIRRLRECNCDGRWINWLCREDCTRSNNIANSDITGISNVSNGNNIISANNVANDNNIIGTTNITETINNNGRNTSCCNNSGNTATQTRFTVTSNQANPVLLLTNRTNTQRRNNCNCCRRCN